MGTYDNCYDIVADIRRGMNEYSVGKMQATDTSGAHLNEELISNANKAQRHLHAILFRRIPHEFLESASVVGVDSVFTLPWDFGIVRRFADENGHKVGRVGVDDRPTATGAGSLREYYRKGNTLILTRSGCTQTYTLWYWRMPRDLTMGMSSAGGALSITLATSAKKLVDYYNGMKIENITDDWVDTISDYTVARVATIGTETGAASKYYGIVSDLPEPFHFLISQLAIMITKGINPVSQEEPGNMEAKLFQIALNDTLLAFAGGDVDVLSEDMWCDFDPGGGGGINIPEQGYTIHG